MFHNLCDVLFIELQRITFQFIAIVGVNGKFHVSSNEDEPGPTCKMTKHSTSARLLKTLSRLESFTIAFNRLTLLKKVCREKLKKRVTDDFLHLLRCARHEKKKECQSSSSDASLSVSDYDDAMMQALLQFKNVAT